MVVLSKLMTDFNLRIFELLLDGSFSVRDLAKEIKCSPAKVIQFMKLYKKDNLIKLSADKNRKIIELDKEHPLTKSIISLIFINKILDCKSFSQLRKNAKSIGVYGSVAEGTVDKHSDIDLWVLADKKKSFADSAELKSRLGKELGKEVSIRFFTPDSVKKLKENDLIFYNELHYKSKVLSGGSFG